MNEARAPIVTWSNCPMLLAVRARVSVPVADWLIVAPHARRPENPRARPALPDLSVHFRRAPCTHFWFRWVRWLDVWPGSEQGCFWRHAVRLMGNINLTGKCWVYISDSNEHYISIQVIHLLLFLDGTIWKSSWIFLFAQCVTILTLAYVASDMSCWWNNVLVD